MDNHHIKISIIIPCFNASEYIDACLMSVLPYVDDNIEVIIINDGSTDDSLDKIKKLISRHHHKNIQVIDQDNAGLSAARNAGLATARGDYVAFLDSDDFYHADFWRFIPQLVDDHTIDIIEFNANQFESTIENITEYLDCAVFDGKTKIEHIAQLRPAFCRSKWYPWARVYKTRLFRDNNIQFPLGRLYEDMTTVPLLYLQSKCIYSLNKSLVWYRFHNKSITQTFRPKDILDLIYVAQVLARIAMDNPAAKSVIFPTMQRVYNFIKYTVVRNRYTKIKQNEWQKLKAALLPFLPYFKLSKQIQIKLLPIYINTVVRFRRK
ncbi:Hyaluronan synthase [Edwardsiella hoshinae]|uniref:Hyaluronan synthase n=1 Tax=Edwardsiella hoshinae TaxID=93378 RepID=A0A376DEX7_9GAMM|nr:glycosyltransferase [Edwardsiella hoshinae]STC87656.1 Hyaluronan synthase [Edwardsiella hoshinae]